MTDDAEKAKKEEEQRQAAERKREEDLRLAEQRVRQEMARQRRAEENQLKAMKVGCIGIIVALVLVLVIGFLFG